MKTQSYLKLIFLRLKNLISKKTIPDKSMVNISYNGDYYRLHTMSNAGLSFLEIKAPFIYLNNNASEIELAQAVLKLLPYYRKINASLFKQLIPKIKEVSNKADEAEMKTYGYSSKKKLYISKIYCHIQYFNEKQQFEISPTHHDSYDGYSGTQFDFFISSASTEQEIGEAIKKGLRLCTAKAAYPLPLVLWISIITV